MGLASRAYLALVLILRFTECGRLRINCMQVGNSERMKDEKILSSLDKCGDEIISMSRAWDKEKNLSSRQDLNL